jgi:hypothetical protein
MFSGLKASCAPWRFGGGTTRSTLACPAKRGSSAFAPQSRGYGGQGDPAAARPFTIHRSICIAAGTCENSRVPANRLAGRNPLRSRRRRALRRRAGSWRRPRRHGWARCRRRSRCWCNRWSRCRRCRWSRCWRCSRRGCWSRSRCWSGCAGWRNSNVINIFFMLPTARVEVEGGGICDIATGLV